MLVAGLLAAPLLAQADTLAVYPETVVLSHERDPERLVVVRTRDDGVTLDVTHEAVLQFAQEGLARWGDDYRLYPQADGETQLTVVHGDLSASLTVTVANAGVVPPRSFRNDVLPALMAGGCNGGGCHGSAQGKNGFHLSLFGYDPPNDYLSLTREMRGRRMNPALPEASLMLQKPLGEVPHEGGTVMEKGDPVYEALYHWIAEGAKDDDVANLPTLTGIELLPGEAVLDGADAQQRFKVRATYSDGTDRDVTDTSILSSSDELTLTIDKAGQAVAGQQGEVYVMARYGTFAVVSQVIVLPAGKTLAWPEDAQPQNFIDDYIFAKLRKLRVAPAPRCSDDVFVRRAYLDVLGVLPTVEETEAFLANEAPDKRAQLIDKLLKRPEFAEVWAMKWAEALRVSTAGMNLNEKSLHRYNDWLRHAIMSNMPLDELVRELLSAEGGNFTAPAANFYLVETDPKLMAENVAQVFMGVQMQCAQCHNHPFERWTMDDYYSFAAFFAQVGRKQGSDPRETIVFNSGTGAVNHLVDNRPMEPRFLGGDQPDLAGRDRREVLGDWLTAPDNPWFARNIANRVWDHYFGRGIINPPDDVRVTNPPSHPRLLEELGQRLVSYDYDLRQLVRDICNSYTYQMSTRPRAGAPSDTRNFNVAQVRRLPAEQLLDAISQVTGHQVKFANLPIGARAVQVADGNSGNYFLEVFGRPARESACTCERRNEPTLAQTLHLINGETINQAIKTPGGLLEQMLESEKPPAEAVEHLYLAALSRRPSDTELSDLAGYVESAEDRRLAMEDVFWSVLNSKEFVFNR